MIDQGLGGDIVYIASKNAVFAGPNNVAYGATKADQAHQVRLLAAELGEHGIRVNGVNPDGVVRGSGIFAGGWGAQRAAVYGVPEEELGAFYAQRTLLKREVLPEHVANAVFALDRRRAVATPRACTSRSTPAWRRPSCDERPATDAGSPPSTSARPAAASSSAQVGDGRPRPHRGAPVPQRPGALPDGLRWDVLGLYRRSSIGLRGRAAARRRRASASTRGPSTTACSTPTARLLGNPYHYRDSRTDGVAGKVHATVPAAERSTPRPGCSTCRSTPLYQLAAGRGTPRSWPPPARCCSSPTCSAYWLTGAAGAEPTNASTTGLLDVRDPRLVHGPRRARSASPLGLLPPLARPGRRARAAAARRPGRRPGCPDAGAVTAVGSHDTASAVVGVPATDERVRVHLPAAPGRSSASSSSSRCSPRRAGAANFTNEAGVDGTDPLPAQHHGPVAAAGVRARLARASRPTCERCSRRPRRCRPAARSSTPTTPTSSPPGDMPARIAEPPAAGPAAEPPEDRAALVRCILDSLAARLPRAPCATPQRLSGRDVDVVHIVGGGARNALLCQLTADACGLPVMAGPGGGHRARQRARPGAGRTARSSGDLDGAAQRSIRATAPACRRASSPAQRH